LEKRLDKDALCHQFCSTYREIALPRKLSKGLETYKIGGQVILTVKCADDILLLPREQRVIQGIFDRLIEIGRYHGMEMNVEKLR